MQRPTNKLMPHGRSDSDRPQNVFPHLLRNKEYDLDWLLWAQQQTYMGKKFLDAVAGRLSELTSIFK